jgi:hypothetical protein
MYEKSLKLKTKIIYVVFTEDFQSIKIIKKIDYSY